MKIILASSQLVNLHVKDQSTGGVALPAHYTTDLDGCRSVYTGKGKRQKNPASPAKGGSEELEEIRKLQWNGSWALCVARRNGTCCVVFWPVVFDFRLLQLFPCGGSICTANNARVPTSILVQRPAAFACFSFSSFLSFSWKKLTCMLFLMLGNNFLLHFLQRNQYIKQVRREGAASEERLPSLLLQREPIEQPGEAVRGRTKLRIHCTPQQQYLL